MGAIIEVMIKEMTGLGAVDDEKWMDGQTQIWFDK